MGKGEIALYEQFLLFPQCFQKACFPGASQGVIVWEWVNNPKIEAFENIVGKGENAGNFSVQPISFCSLQTLSIWTSLEICCLVKS